MRSWKQFDILDWLAIALFIFVAIGAAGRFSKSVVRAQGAVPNYYEMGIPSSSTPASCPIPPAQTPALTTFCFTGDGKISYSINGGAWIQNTGPAGPAGATGAQGPAGPQGPAGSSGTGSVTSVQINGVTKPGPVPSFTLSTPTTVSAQ